MLSEARADVRRVGHQDRWNVRGMLLRPPKEAKYALNRTRSTDSMPLAKFVFKHIPK